MVVTWIGDVRPLLEEPNYAEYWRQLPEFRKEKAEKYRFAKDRALSVGVWILWQRIRENYQLWENAPFNLSHSGCYALCSAQIQGDGQAQVGCDVQRIGSYSEGVAKRFFKEREYHHIQSRQSLREQAELFFRYWALKESFIKATGKGMAMGLDSFGFSMEEGRYPVLEDCPRPYKKENYFFREFELQSYRAAVCSTDPVIDSSLQWVCF